VESLATELELSVANVSQHVRALKQAALVETRIGGSRSCEEQGLRCVLPRRGASLSLGSVRQQLP
jgi:DNA-binding transcriptional ArsR family regulator